LGQSIGRFGRRLELGLGRGGGFRRQLVGHGEFRRPLGLVERGGFRKQLGLVGHDDGEW